MNDDTNQTKHSINEGKLSIVSNVPNESNVPNVSNVSNCPCPLPKQYCSLLNSRCVVTFWRPRTRVRVHHVTPPRLRHDITAPLNKKLTFHRRLLGRGIPKQLPSVRFSSLLIKDQLLYIFRLRLSEKH